MVLLCMVYVIEPALDGASAVRKDVDHYVGGKSCQWDWPVNEAPVLGSAEPRSQSLGTGLGSAFNP